MAACVPSLEKIEGLNFKHNSERERITMSRFIVWSSGTLMLAATLLLTSAGSNTAQARGFHGGYHHGGYHYRGFYHHGYYAHRYFYPSYGVYVNPTYYGNGCAVYPQSSGYYFDVSPAPVIATAPQYASPANMADSKVHLTILLPDPNAAVKIDGQEVAGTGTARQFVSPDVADGDYSYEVQASWIQNGKLVTQTNSVKVKPGAASLVSFTPAQ